MPIDEHVAHGEVLRKSHHRVIDRSVAVRMVAAEHVADAGRGLLERLIARQAVLVHCVEYAPVNGLETIAHIRQRSADNDGHGVVDIAGLHFAHQLRLGYDLIRKRYILRFVISLMCH